MLRPWLKRLSTPDGHHSEISQISKASVCFSCGKSYLSQPALTNHVKTKHATQNSDPKRGRGRPRKNPSGNVNFNLSYDQKFGNFFRDKEIRTIKPNEEFCYENVANETLMEMFVAFKEKIFVNISEPQKHPLYYPKKEKEPKVEKVEKVEEIKKEEENETKNQPANLAEKVEKEETEKKDEKGDENSQINQKKEAEDAQIENNTSNFQEGEIKETKENHVEAENKVETEEKKDDLKEELNPIESPEKNDEGGSNIIENNINGEVQNRENYKPDNGIPNSSIADPKLTCDNIFKKYIEISATKVNEEYFKFLYKFAVLFRECINIIRNKAEEPKGENEVFADYTTKYNAETVPDLCNEFITDFMENNEYFGLEMNELIDLIQHFCYWLYESSYTSSRLTLLSS